MGVALSEILHYLYCRGLKLYVGKNASLRGNGELGSWGISLVDLIYV